MGQGGNGLGRGMRKKEHVYIFTECSLDWLERVGKVDIASPDQPLVAVGRKSRSLRP